VLKPYLLQTLKELALLGAIRNKIEISSQELAQQLNISQQTASRYLLDLDNSELISRELGIKKQLIELSPLGTEALEREFSQYKQIFDLPSKVVFKGKLVSGMGEGTYYTEQKGYAQQFKNQLGFTPHPGTFNVEIDQVERNKLRLLKNYGGILIDAFTDNNRTFGGVLCFHATINTKKGAIVLPRRSHYSTILELISPLYLRDILNVSDGDTIEVIVSLDE